MRTPPDTGLARPDGTLSMAAVAAAGIVGGLIAVDLLFAALVGRRIFRDLDVADRVRTLRAVKDCGCA